MHASTSDGVTLCIAKLGEGPPILCLHAMMTDARYFGVRRQTGFAPQLAARGFTVYVAEFRGHGASAPPVAGPDDWSFDDLVELDLPAIVNAVMADAGAPPIILGHSLGGLVATAAIGTGRIAPPTLLYLAATAVWLGGGTLRRRLGMFAYREITRLVGHAPIRALRAGNNDEAGSYVAQLAGWARSGRWTSLRGVDYRAALQTIEARTIPFAGGADWMCTPADARGFCGLIPGAEPLRILGDADHFVLFTRPADALDLVLRTAR